MVRNRHRAAMAVLVALALWIGTVIRRRRKDGRRAARAVPPAAITPIEAAELSESARVIGSAFATEAFTTTAFGGAVQQVEDDYTRAIELLLRAHIDAGQPVFTATTEGEVVGVAAITRPGGSVAPVRIVVLFTRHLPVVVRLLRRMDWVGVYHVARTILPPAGLRSAHYRLEAIGVEPAAQGAGIGRALLKATHDLVDADPGASGIYLVTGEDSTRQLYEQFGYETVATKQSNGVVAYHMFRPSEPAGDGDD